MPPTKKPAHETAAAAIAAAQANMSNAIKDAKNPHFKSNYASLAAVRDVVIPAFAAEGVAILQPIEGENGCCCVRTLLMWGDQTIEAGNCSIPIGNGRNAAQDVGSVATYLRRYQLAAVGGIGQEDDDAQSQTRKQPQRREPVNQYPAMPGAKCPACGGRVHDNRKNPHCVSNGGDQPFFYCLEDKACTAYNGTVPWGEFTDPNLFDKPATPKASKPATTAKPGEIPF
jgi:hypothetical protein